MLKRFFVMLVVLFVGFGLIGAARAAEVRQNEVPDVAFRDEGDLPLGDAWTFSCPVGGTAVLAVDTLANNEGLSRLDLIAYVVDRAGNLLGIGDDDAECTHPPTCRFACPRINIACGVGPHYIFVRDYGSDESAEACNAGGGYKLTIEVRDHTGHVIASKLGGGAHRSVPSLFQEAGLAGTGPLANDEGIPEWWSFDFEDPPSPATSVPHSQQQQKARR